MELPVEFARMMEPLLGEDFKQFEQAIQSEPSVSIRVNTNKHHCNSGAERVPWAEDAYYLTERPQFTFDPLFHAGCYYVQEASSMFLHQVVKIYIHQPVRALDLCAAPGGKSTLLLQSLPHNSVLVSNEIMPQRAQILKENLIKWGNPNILVTSNDSADFSSIQECFDFILVDAPCSGEGMFRKDETAVAEWSEANVALCVNRQHTILENIWSCLKPGGVLVYSTCTYNIHEDEETVQWLVNRYNAQSLPVPTDSSWGIHAALGDYSNLYAYRFLPHLTKGEGLFMAALRKEGELEPNPVLDAKPRKSSKKVREIPIPAGCKEWIKSPNDYHFTWQSDTLIALPHAVVPLFDALSAQGLHLLQAGISLATMKGKDMIPHHNLAMSQQMNSDVFVATQLTYKQAIAYLRKEAIVLDASVPKGYVMVCYENVPLGFVKQLGNRANNLYPQEWRIRSGFVPEVIPHVL